MSLFYEGFLCFLKLINWDTRERPLAKVFLTGRLNVWTGADNYTANTVLSPFARFSKLFGFTPSEAEGCLKASGLSDRMALAIGRCGGYRFGDDEILRPASVRKLIADAQKAAGAGAKQDVPGGCRRQPPGSDRAAQISICIATLSRIDNRTLQALVDGDEAEVAVRSELDMGYDRLDLGCARDIWSLLLHLGCVTSVGEAEEGARRYLKIPNAEARQIFCDSIRAGFAEYMERGGEGMKAVRALLNGDCDGAKELVQELLRGYVCIEPSCRCRRQDLFYESMLVTLLSSRVGHEIGDLRYLPKAREDGPGMIFKSREGGIAVAIALKATATKDELDGAALAALKQVEDRDCAEKLMVRGAIRKTVAIGMSFCKRVCEADCRILKSGGQARLEGRTAFPVQKRCRRRERLPQNCLQDQVRRCSKQGS